LTTRRCLPGSSSTPGGSRECGLPRTSIEDRSPHGSSIGNTSHGADASVGAEHER
jgi:hypothetical protein